MKITNESVGQEYRPRVLIWQLAPPRIAGSAIPAGLHNGDVLSTSECLLILESIARVSKPIVVFTGDGVLRRPDMHTIVEYGIALGLKLIVEASPQDLTDELMRSFSSFGPKIFRILLDGCIVEDMDTRYKPTNEFIALEEKVARLKKEGFEIHLSTTVRKPGIRELAFEWDYAFRTAAHGLYCHLHFIGTKSRPANQEEPTETPDGLIEAIARIKQFSPDRMYISPQCVKYGMVSDMHEPRHEDNEMSQKTGSQWRHWCLAGKAFAFINHSGQVQGCIGLRAEGGNLRANNYDFESIWLESHVFQRLRQMTLSCSETQAELKPHSTARP